MQKHTKNIQKKYKDICTLLKVREEYSLLKDLKGIDALGGLKLYTMVLVYCHERCNRLFATGDSMRKHYKKDHRFKGQQLPLIWHIVAVQQIDKSKHNQYFYVKVHLTCLGHL